MALLQRVWAKQFWQTRCPCLRDLLAWQMLPALAMGAAGELLVHRNSKGEVTSLLRRTHCGRDRGISRRVETPRSTDSSVGCPVALARPQIPFTWPGCVSLCSPVCLAELSMFVLCAVWRWSLLLRFCFLCSCWDVVPDSERLYCFREKHRICLWC